MFLFFFCGASLALNAQTVEELVAQAQKLELQMKEAESLQKYREILQVSPGHVQALNQASLLCSREGTRQKDKSAKQDYFNDAKNYAFEALKVEPENAESNYAMAVALGRIALISGAKEKVAASKEVKRYADLALKYRPDYAEAWHLIGKWNYELFNLGAIEKAAAKVLFGGVPPGTMEDAIAAYEKCRKLKPSFILNYYDLAVAYKESNQETLAMEVLNKALRLRPIRQDDPGYKADCKKMLDAMQ